MSNLSRLESLIRSTRAMPPKIILYGQPGVGKTTFAAAAKSLLIDCENGAGVFHGLVRTPYLETWPDMAAWLAELRRDWPVDCKALAIDTIDWMMLRIREHVVHEMDPKASDDLVNTLGTSHGGFFKGREVVENVVNCRLLPALNAINAKGVPIILLAHAVPGKSTTPEGYDLRLAEPKILAGFASMFQEWADAILYASVENDGGRVVVTQMTNTVTAKNRYGLPAHMKLDWNELVAAIRSTSDKVTAETSARSN